jgi:hypothetical protein
MQAKTNYEKIILKEIRELPGDVMPQVLKIVRSIKESLSVGRITSKKREQTSGLCGIWQDDRSAEEIIEDIRKHRTGFGGREIRL